MTIHIGDKTYMPVELDGFAYMPTRAHAEDAGLDLRTPKRLVVRAGGRVVVDTGVHVEIPCGCMGEIRSKSGLMTRDGILTDGTVDEGYSGSIAVCLFNLSGKHKMFDAGDKIAQLVITKIEKPEPVLVEHVAGGERGSDGFGSTGK